MGRRSALGLGAGGGLELGACGVPSSAPSSPSAASSHSSIFRAHSSTLDCGSRSLSGPPASHIHMAHAGSAGAEQQACAQGRSTPAPDAAATTTEHKGQGQPTADAASAARSSIPPRKVAPEAQARAAAAAPHVLRRSACQRPSTPAGAGRWAMLLGLLAVLLLGLLAARPALQHTRFSAQGGMSAGPCERCSSHAASPQHAPSVAPPSASSLQAAPDGGSGAVGHCAGGATDGACCGDAAWLLQRSHVLQSEFAALRRGLAGVSRELGRLAGQLGQQAAVGVGREQGRT